jgi:hypothetical protein
VKPATAIVPLPAATVTQPQKISLPDLLLIAMWRALTNQSQNALVVTDIVHLDAILTTTVNVRKDAMTAPAQAPKNVVSV